MSNIADRQRNGKSATNGTAENSDKPFIKLTKNFANFPIARNSRVAMSWRKSADSGRWLADLPGNTRIGFRLPADVDEELKRAPDGFDFKVSMALLRLAHMRDDRMVTFASNAALLNEMKADKRDGRVYAKLNAALTLWQNLTIKFGCW